MFSNHLSLVKCLVSPCCLCTCVYMCVLARVYAFVLPCSSLPPLSSQSHEFRVSLVVLQSEGC